MHCCQWLSESPRFDIARGMPDRAMATLERVARENGKPMPSGSLDDVIREVSVIVVSVRDVRINSLTKSNTLFVAFVDVPFPGLILSVQSNQFVQTKMQFVHSKLKTSLCSFPRVTSLRSSLLNRPPVAATRHCSCAFKSADIEVWS